jgi:Protein phosphatase 2C
MSLRLLSERSSAWSIRAASMPGAHHLDDAGPCQDAFATARLDHPDGEVVVLVMADGAGSASRAVEGATLAVGCTMASVRRRLDAVLPTDGTSWRELLTAVAEDAADRVGKAADAIDAPREELASTLGVALLCGSWVSVLALGDAFCVVRRRDGGLHAFLAAASTGADPTRTTMLTQPEAVAAANSIVIEDDGVAACLLSSDGLETSALLRTGTAPDPYRPFLEPVLDSDSGSSGLARFLLTDDHLLETTDDDRTLVLAVRR